MLVVSAADLALIMLKSFFIIGNSFGTCRIVRLPNMISP